MADAITGNTQLSATKNDLIIPFVQKELAFNAKLMPYSTDFSAYVGKGMKSIKVPKLTSFSVVDRASGAAGDATVLTSSTDTINLDYAAYIAWIVDSQDEIQSSIEVQLENVKRAAAAHGRYFDEQLLVKLFAATGYAQTGAITAAKILNMRQYLLKNDALREELVLAVAVDQEGVMLQIDGFTRADMYGSSNIPSGVIGQVYGVPVVVHNGLADGEALMWAKSGIGHAFQLQPNMSEQGANEYGSTAKRVALDQLFGIGALQVGLKGEISPASPMITSLTAT